MHRTEGVYKVCSDDVLCQKHRQDTDVQISLYTSKHVYSVTIRIYSDGPPPVTDALIRR